LKLFHLQNETFQIFSFGVVDVDGVVGRLRQLVQYADAASGLGGSAEDG